MPTTLQQAITAARSMLDEANARFWTDDEIAEWVNGACRDIARRAEVIQSFNTTIAAVIGQGKYPLPADVIRVHHIDFVPTGSTQTYPVSHSTIQEAQRVWGTYQNQQSSYPYIFVLWGTPGAQYATVGTDAQLTIQFYPVPAQTGVFNIYYYRLPYNFLPPLSNPGEYAKFCEIPEGWQDLITDFIEYRGRRKNRDPLWSEAKQEYEEKVEQMVDVTRQWHDQQRMIMTSSGVSQPSWLIDPDWGEW